MHRETDALVLRSQPTGEQDCLLTLLTAEHGVLTAYAAGVRRSKSKLRAACELLSYSDFVLFEYRGKRTVDTAAVNRVFSGVRADVFKLALCCYFAQITAESGVAEVSTDAQLRLFLTSLHLLDKGKRGCLQVKPVFELRLLTLLGFQPDLTGCMGCGVMEHERMYFSPADGGILCGDCAGTATALPEVTGELLRGMRQMVYGSLEDGFGVQLSEDGWRRLNGITEDFAVRQLEKRFSALDYFKSL